MKKKGWLTLLASLMLVFTAACGGSGGAKAPEGGTGTTSEGNGEAAPKQDTVVVWTYPVHGKYEDELKEHVADLKEKYPHITVQTEVLSWAEGPKKFDVALNAGNPPDLYFHAVDGAYVDTGLALELTPYITDEIKNDYLPGTLELGQIQGKQYGLPLYQSLWAWGGNKKILEEAGIDWKAIQENGWTWTEFKAAAEKLTKKLPNGNTQYALVTDGTSLDFMEMLTRSNGMPDVLNDKGEFQWNDERILDTMTFVSDLMKAGHLPAETAAITPAKRMDLFYAEEAAIVSKAIPYYDVMLQNRAKDIDSGTVQGAKIDFVLLPVPHNDGAERKTSMFGEGYVAFKQKKDKGEEHAKNTFLIMEGLSGAKAGNSANELVLPFVRKSQAEFYEGKGLGTESTIKAAEIFANFKEIPVTLNLDAEASGNQKKFKEQVVKPNIQALFSGEKTPEQIAQDFKDKGKQILGQ